MKGSSRPHMVTVCHRSLPSPHLLSCSHSILSGVKQFHLRIGHNPKEVCNMLYEIHIKFGGRWEKADKEHKTNAFHALKTWKVRQMKSFCSPKEITGRSLVV